MTEQSDRLGAGRHHDLADAPVEATATVHRLLTADGAVVTGILRTIPQATVVAFLMHPRQDLTHHPLVPELLRRGCAVWTQGSRSVNNDLSLLHEQALLDAAAGYGFLRQRGIDAIVSIGHSGGGALQAFYHQQAGRIPSDRITHAPSGKPVGLAEAEMPVPDGAVFLAPHLGPSLILERMIDPSVVDEDDPLSVDEELNCFNPANGFAEAPTSSSFTPEFVERYRTAQRQRMTKLDARAREMVRDADDARASYTASHLAVDRRHSIVPRLMTVYRTDADVRTVDLGIDANERPYGSVFGRRPDLTNYGLVGFGRLSTADCWLSTWSSLSSNADFCRCGPEVTAPTLFLEMSGDQASFPSEGKAMRESLGASDLSADVISGTHFGGSAHPGRPSGTEMAASAIWKWIGQKFS